MVQRRSRRSGGQASELILLRQQRSNGADQDLSGALTLLAGTRSGATGPTLRIYRPEPTVAFGQRDRKLSGFARAESASRSLGFEPLVRRAGGRAAAYHPGCLVIDHIEPDPDPIRESQARFSTFAQLFAQALELIGVQARVGPLPHEYCWGEYSVHGVAPDAADTRVKLVGTAQRQIATGWLFSTSIVVEDGATIRRVLTETYAALGLGWDPLTAGAITDLQPDITVDDVEQAILETYAQHWSLREMPYPW